MLNPFENPGFSTASLTAAINLLPNRYGRIQELGIFPAKPVRFRSVAVEEHNGVLSLLPTMPVGSPGTVGVRGKRALRSFAIPHIPHDDVVLPEEVQGIRAFGSETAMENIAAVVADHLRSMRNKHAITLEHLRMGALKGIILDADGSQLYNLFDEFGITPIVINFQLGAATTDVKKKCLDLKRHIEKSIRGERMTSVHCLVSSEFFDALTGHPKVVDAYHRWQDSFALRSDMRSSFNFAGITFEEYAGEASDANGTTRRFIAAGDGHTFPLGTVDTFSTYFAPADFNETANTLGHQLYAKQQRRQFDRGTDLHTQSNPLPMCHRPGVLVRVTAA